MRLERIYKLKPPISFELFRKYMGDIMSSHDLQHNIGMLLSTYRKETKDDAEISFPTAMESDIVELLSVIFNDESDWIGYWIYDLECGDEYHDGCVVSTVDGHEVNVPLRTVEDLWNLLISNDE